MNEFTSTTEQSTNADQIITAPFTICIRTTGGLVPSFVFINENDTLPRLEKKYGKLDLHETSLPALKIMDKCRVIGEGEEVFTIVSLKKYSDHRYGFCLDSGWCEEVAKCYRV